MQDKNMKKVGFVGFVAGLAVLTMASAAFACTSYKGKATITGINGTTINGTAGGSVTYEGDGTDNTQPSAGYCKTPSRVDVDTGAGPLDFNLTVAPFVCPATNLHDRVADGLWEVRWVKAEKDIVYDGLPRPICHFNVYDSSTTTENPTSRWVPLGYMTIRDGSGGGNYALPPTMVGPGNICVEKILGTSRDGTFPIGSDTSAPPAIFINKVNLI